MTRVPRAVATDEEIRIPVMEEELTATVREQEAGAVRIEKDVVTEERTLDVPVTEERVRVERRVVDRPVSAADADAFEETVIEVPLRTETVDVQKQARVAEEVVVSKEAIQRTERVTDTVRREEVFVDEDATVDASFIDDRDRERPRRSRPRPSFGLNRIVAPWLLPTCSARALAIDLAWDRSRYPGHNCTAPVPLTIVSSC